MSLQLSRDVPKHVRVEKFNWLKRDFMPMSDNYRKVRARHGLKPMDACYWCKWKFVNGEMMALAQPLKGKNKLLCQKCARLMTAVSEESANG